MTDGMTRYEEKAWAEIRCWKKAQLERTERHWLPDPVRKALSAAGDAAETVWNNVPGHTQAQQALKAAADGAFRALSDAANQTLLRQRVVDSYKRVSDGMFELDDIKKLDLKVLDDVRPPLGSRYALGLAFEGGGSGAVMGGATAGAATGGVVGGGVGALPGAGIAIGVLAADTASLIVGSFRAVAHYAAYYGYDTRNPAELAFALGVIRAASAGDQAAKQGAFADLYRITGQLARNATWKQLEQDPFVVLARKLFSSINETLIKKKLAQTILVIGIAIGFGVNYRFMTNVCENAHFIYRERFLREKYGLSDDSS